MHCLYSLTARECLRISGDNLGNFDGKKSFLLSKIFLGTVLSPEILRDVRSNRNKRYGVQGELMRERDREREKERERTKEKMVRLYKL